MSDIVKSLIDDNADKIVKIYDLQQEVNRLALKCAALQEERDDLTRTLAQWVKSHKGLSKQLEKHTRSRSRFG